MTSPRRPGTLLRQPFAAFQLDQGRVRTVLLDLDELSQELESVAETLNEDERGRRDRFRFEADRRRYGIGRGVLRALLGSILKVSPGEVAISTGRHGKPYLADTAVGFNVSHSGSMLLYAFSLGKEVGVDIEQLSSSAPDDGLAKTVFSAAELLRWKSLTSEARRHVFFEIWTRKEALLKATGVGLSIEPHTIEPGLGHTQSVDIPSAPTSRWTVRSLDVGGSYAAAVAIEGDQMQTELRDLQGGLVQG